MKQSVNYWKKVASKIFLVIKTDKKSLSKVTARKWAIFRNQAIWTMLLSYKFWIQLKHLPSQIIGKKSKLFL